MAEVKVVSVKFLHEDNKPADRYLKFVARVRVSITEPPVSTFECNLQLSAEQKDHKPTKAVIKMSVRAETYDLVAKLRRAGLTTVKSFPGLREMVEAKALELWGKLIFTDDDFPVVKKEQLDMFVTGHGQVTMTLNGLELNGYTYYGKLWYKQRADNQWQFFQGRVGYAKDQNYVTGTTARNINFYAIERIGVFLRPLLPIAQQSLHGDLAKAEIRALESDLSNARAGLDEGNQIVRRAKSDIERLEKLLEEKGLALRNATQVPDDNISSSVWPSKGENHE
jgi:hypothetical protein